MKNNYSILLGQSYFVFQLFSSHYLILKLQFFVSEVKTTIKCRYIGLNTRTYLLHRRLSASISFISCSVLLRSL